MTFLPILVNECPRNLYRVPAIDNRRRTSISMWRTVMDHYGPGEHQGRLRKLDGTTVNIRFTWSGWGEPDAAFVEAVNG